MLLEIKELTKEYKRNGAPFSAVKDVRLSLDTRDFVSVIGRSGSGKTTLLSMTAGLLKPTGGSVTLEGRNIFDLKDEELSFVRNARVGYIPQGMSLLPNLTALDNVRLPFYLSKREGDAAAKALSLLDQVGISHLALIYPKQLSGGEQRRVSIARALINDPAILIADEPTGDLDADTTAEIMKLFGRIAQNGTAILLVTHEPDTISYGNRVYVMNAGTLTGKTETG
ncbi:MAG: ABC transporter ATP-binding protein [Spirochaetales bacterium]|jgi:putative ABC transport system ATP-binding protein|nr:ABC transporter ATP-binding protein [Spirochaetales bacterium]